MRKILNNLKARARRWTQPGRLVFDRPLVLFQSDDWGRTGIRDREGFELLLNAGVNLGENPYDFYSLETAADVGALHELLLRHRDSVGRHPCIGMNFIVGNVNFNQTLEDDFRRIYILPLIEGLPDPWKRPELFDAYRNGIADGVFYPTLHGTTHFCRSAVAEILAANGEGAELLRTFWKSGTSYIYWRMPWIGYEYWHPARKEFLDASEQTKLIGEATDLFRKMFGRPAFSACAPGYRANDATQLEWARQGIHVAQNGSGGTSPMHVNGDVLHTYRNVDFEPATEGSAFSFEDCLRRAQEKLDSGQPAVISLHSINFHSTLKDFRTSTLQWLDRFFGALESRYSDLLYVHDEDLYRLATQGKCEGPHADIAVVSKQTNQAGKVEGLR
jgi:hypothetical protein